jgi:putative copper export protein
LHSGYGRLLLIKLSLIVLLAAFGAVNWRVLRPALSDGIALQRLRRSATVELVIGAAVLAVTAVLVATSPPGDDATDQPSAAATAPATAPPS